MENTDEKKTRKQKFIYGIDAPIDQCRPTDNDTDVEESNEASTSAVATPQINEKTNGLHSEDNEIITVKICKQKLSYGTNAPIDQCRPTCNDTDIEKSNEDSASAVATPQINEETNGLNSEDNEIITVDSYTKYSPEQIRAQMVKTVVEDPVTISTFADRDFQKLVWMANRSFTVPNIEEVLQERFKKEQMKLTNTLAEHPSAYDICIFPLTIINEKYAILELSYFDESGHFATYLLDCFSLAKSKTNQHFLSEKIREKIMEFKMEKKIGGVYIWDSKFKKLRSELYTKLLVQKHVDKRTTNTRLALMDLQTELNELQQLLSEDQPECIRIVSNFCNHDQTELIKLGKLIEKCRLFDTEVRAKMGTELNNNEEKIAYCQHIKPKLPHNLFRFTRMDIYEDVILEIVSCLGGSRKIPIKILKPNLETIPSDRREQILDMLKECKTLVDSGIETYEQFTALSDSIRNNRKSIEYPFSKPFLDVAARATAIVNVQQHLWMMVAFLRIWEKSPQEISASHSSDSTT